MTCEIFSVRWWLVLALFISQMYCSIFGQTGKVKFDEAFTLRSGETVETEDAKLSIRLKGVGRTISESGEVEYVELQVTLNKSERRINISESKNQTAVIGNFIIKLINADSFGEANCELKVSRKK